MTQPKPPQPPQPTWSPSQIESQTSGGFPQPHGARLDISDVTPFAEPLDPPVYGSVTSGADMLCDSCSKCWKMGLAGQFFNKKADGSDFVLTERFCVFKDSLVSLSERVVLSCSRYEEKKEK